MKYPHEIIIPCLNCSKQTEKGFIFISDGIGYYICPDCGESLKILMKDKSSLKCEILNLDYDF